MKLKWPFLLLLVVILLAGSAAPARADGIIIPPPCPERGCPPPPPCPGLDCPPISPRPMEQLVIRYHRVNVTIEDQLAVTRVDQVFYNPNTWAVEGTYVFPLPLDAVVSSFTLWVDGTPVKGEVLDANEARQYYEETVRNLRDPALLEYQGRGAVKASVFPIQPKDERRIELEYTQALTSENGLVRYVYPLSTEKFSLLPLEDVSIRVEIRDRQAIRAVYSPSHAVAFDRAGQNQVTAGYEAKNVLPDSDFSLYYSLGETEAFHLFSYRNPADPSDPDGFFMMLLAPKPDLGGADSPRVAKDVLLVLDRSGSMEGQQKFQQAQSALRYILQHLNPEDRFYLQAFSTGIETYASGLRPATEVNEALAWVDSLSARGSTDINRALLEAAAVADRERPTYLIFLTDGLPTEGVIDRQQILDNFNSTAPDNLRLFAFGVGYDVDTFLLDTLSQEHHGQTTYVRQEDPLDEVLSAFYEKISIPVLTDLKLNFGGQAAYDIYPDPLPDLFSGSQVIVVGRYRQGGAFDVTLTGQVNGTQQVFRYPGQPFVEDSLRAAGAASNLEMLPRLWATRKVGYLLNAIRLQGADRETIQQIVQLSVRYGIVTPYTSYLVTEQMPFGADAQDRIAEKALDNAQSAPMGASGQGAVERAAGEGEMRSADVAPAVPQAGMSGGSGGGLDGTNTPGTGRPEGENQAAAIRIVGTRTFLFQAGTWVDTAYDPEKMQAQQVVFLSEDYFRLLEARPDLSPAFALGEQVTLVVDGQVFEVVREGQAENPLTLPPALSTPEAQPQGQATSAPGELPAATQPADVQPTVGPAVAPPETTERQSPSCALGFLPVAVLLGAAWVLRRHA